MKKAIYRLILFFDEHVLPVVIVLFFGILVVFFFWDTVIPIIMNLVKGLMIHWKEFFGLWAGTLGLYFVFLGIRSIYRCAIEKVRNRLIELE